MASSNTFLSEDQFLCSICLDVFTEPVSTPCGHNYCQTCITGYWAGRELSQCPLCKETFHTTPELRVNTGFREVVEHFKKMRVVGDDDSPAEPGEVPCDVCPGTKLKALKSCLVCLASYCQTHLEPHQRVPALKRHKLINPVENLEERVCKKHDKVMEFFCRRDQMCVCAMCLKDDHMMHETVSLEQEFGERKARLRKMKRQIKWNLEAKCFKIQKIKHSVTQGRKDAAGAIADSIKAFSALVASIETNKAKLVELLEEKQRAAEQQANGFIQQLQLEIAELQRRSKELEELSNTDDHLQLLQSLPPLSSPSHTEDCSEITDRSLLHAETVRRAVAKLEETLSKEMEEIFREVNQVDKKNETAEEQMKTPSGEPENLFEDELRKIQRQHAADVTLDPDTAHSCLILSQDGKQVRDRGAKRNVPDNPKRFDFFHFVLGKEGFSSGRFYYEVKVEGQAGWEVGVAREHIDRKGVNVSLSPESGCWTVGLYWGHYQANANPPVVLHLTQQLQKVGVFVDYDGGEVSFYDVETRALIYSFTGCTFTASQPFLKNLFLFYSHGRKIYPLFRPGTESSAPLQITPVS
ncbi:zinc finger protein RFP-like [Centroberyx gerrardi]